MLLLPVLLSFSSLLQTGGGWDDIYSGNGSGSATQENHGATLAELGDVNGDGYTDYAVGRPGFSGNPSHNGAVRVLSGFDHSLIW
jgi:hypothetical protein